MFLEKEQLAPHSASSSELGWPRRLWVQLGSGPILPGWSDPDADEGLAGTGSLCPLLPEIPGPLPGGSRFPGEGGELGAPVTVKWGAQPAAGPSWTLGPALGLHKSHQL